MAATNFIKFCASIVHSQPNNMTLLAFPGKIPEIEKNILKLFLWPSPNVAPNPTDQCRSNSISRVPLQILPLLFLIWTVKIKGSSHKKKIKHLDFLENGSNDFHQIF